MVQESVFRVMKESVHNVVPLHGGVSSAWWRSVQHDVVKESVLCVVEESVHRVVKEDVIHLVEESVHSVVKEGVLHVVESVLCVVEESVHDVV